MYDPVLRQISSEWLVMTGAMLPVQLSHRALVRVAVFQGQDASAFRDLA